ncbi:Ger(x)C family spore germination protein [Candidatus Parcubacteria bacterium]|nr:MAG: Ger(x)C family spore germination protein [Candidatus Parcubacteria bacterium]
MHKKFLVIFLFFLTFTCLSGCWDNKDINHRVMPVVLGIGSSEDGYKVFMEIPVPKEDSMEIRIVSGVGETVNQVMDDLSKNIESSVDLLHVKVIVISSDLAEAGVKDLFAGFMRSRDVSPKALVAISEDSLDELFSILEQSTESDSTILLDCFEKNAGWGPQIALTRIWQVYRSIHSYTLDVAIPLIKMGGTTLIEQSGSAVIKNGKMVGKISSNETLLYNAFQGESTHGKIEVLKEASVIIVANSMHHESDMNHDVPHLKSKINIKVMLLETRGDPSLSKIKMDLETLLNERFDRMFSSVQSTQADILGIGQLFRREIPRKNLKDWRSRYYPNMTMDMKVHVEIQNNGNLKTPAN